VVLLLEGIGAAALARVTNFPEAVLVASIIGAAEGITWPALWIPPLAAGFLGTAAVTLGLGRRLPGRQSGQLPALRP
jgi:hypothetical protein